jgi:hypothetical protein
MRSDYDQIQSQYQQYNSNVQRHIQELNEQVGFYSLLKSLPNFL